MHTHLTADLIQTETEPIQVDKHTPSPELVPEIEETEELKAARLRVWEHFREEQQEVIDQVPLHLIRQYSLIRHLDEHVLVHSEQLLPTLQTYLALRLDIAERTSSPRSGVIAAAPEPPAAAHIRTSTTFGNNAEAGPSTLSVNRCSNEMEDIKMEDDHISTQFPPEKRSSMATLTPTAPPSLVKRFRLTTGLGLQRCNSSSISIPTERVRPPRTTRELLSHIAWLSEEVLQASQEKRNVAQSAVDYVQRHIFELDQKIQEEETSIALGTRAGTHPAHFILPEIVPPVRTRNAIARQEAEEPAGQLPLDNVTTIGTVASHNPNPTNKKRGGGGRKGTGTGTGRRKGKKVQTVTPRKSIKSVVAEPLEPIMVDAFLRENGEIQALDSTPYCYCRQPSHGEMVGCDGPDCPIEWYHLPCIGLAELPKPDDEWFCPECSDQPEFGARRTRRS